MCEGSSSWYMREVIGILHNLTDMCRKASACIGLHVGMVPESYHRMSRRLCCSSHSSVVVGHNTLDKVVLLIQCHVADVMMEVTLSADVASLATAVAGLCDGFEDPSTVDVHRDARRKCARRDVHCCRDRSGGGT
jgi:hypothetical protein